MTRKRYIKGFIEEQIKELIHGEEALIEMYLAGVSVHRVEDMKM